MGECLDRMEQYIDQPNVFEAESRRFHTVVADATDSPVLAMLVNAIEAVAYGLRDESTTDARNSVRAKRATLVFLHQRIYQALGNRDGDAVTVAMEDLVDAMWLTAAGRPRAKRGVRSAARAWLS
jgi:DNA-binding FadR family transcriptional regulator